MATLYCDNDQRHPQADAAEPATWLVSRLTDGESQAWCDPCYLELCMLVAQQAVEQLPDDQPAAPAPEPDRDDEDADDAEALARLEAEGRARTADTAAVGSESSNGASGPPSPAEAAQEPAPDIDQAQQDGAQEPAPATVEPAQVVKRGTSRSRRGHEARKRSKAKAAASGSTDD